MPSRAFGKIAGMRLLSFPSDWMMSEMPDKNVSQVKPVRWGVLGAADIALQRVIPALLATKNQHFVALASRKAERVRERFAHMPELCIYDSYQSLLDDPNIEVIYNPLP